MSYLGTRDAIEADRHEHSSNRNLVITKFDAIEIQDAQAVRGDEAIESENLVHLNSRDEGGSSLANDVRDWHTHNAVSTPL